MGRCPSCQRTFDDDVEVCPHDGQLLAHPITQVAYPPPLPDRPASPGPTNLETPPSRTAVEDDSVTAVPLSMVVEVPTSPTTPRSLVAATAAERPPSDETVPPKASRAMGAEQSGELLSGIFEPGTELGSYRLVKLLGKGGMGEVYQAVHKTLNKAFAIKLLRSRYAADRQAVQRFFREAQAACRIDHPNIVAISDFVEDAAGACFYVMEYLDGESLADRLDLGPVPVGELLPIAQQTAAALDALHRAGVIHRDLKPGNIFLVKRPEGPPLVKVLDFGLAKLEDGLGRAIDGETNPNFILGTPEYMAPEQIRGEDIDLRIDTYAFGVVLYEALRGKRPLSAPTAGELLVKVVTEAPPSLRDALPDLSPELEKLVMDCLAKAPVDRPTDAVLLRKLDELVKAAQPEEPAVELSLAPTLPPSLALDRTAQVLPAFSESESRPRWLLPLALLALLLLLGGGLWLALRKPAVQSKPGAKRVYIAHLVELWRKVEHRPRNEQGWHAAKRSMRLAHLDTLRTADGARAEVTFDAGGKLDIAEEAEVLIEAPRAERPGGPKIMQVAHVRRGVVRGEAAPGRPLRLIGRGGKAAEIVAQDGKPVRFRVREGKGGRLEVAVLDGKAKLRVGSRSIDVERNQLVDVGGGGALRTVRLLAFPELLAPAVDAPVAGTPIIMRWQAVPGAAAYRLQVSTTVGFVRRIDDRVIGGTQTTIAPTTAGRYVWRVRSIDASGHEGEFGYARRFRLLNALAAPDAALPTPKVPAKIRRPRIPKLPTPVLLSPPAGVTLEIGSKPERVVFRWKPRVKAQLVVAHNRTLRRGVVGSLAVDSEFAELSLGQPGRYYWGLCADATCRKGTRGRPRLLIVKRRTPPVLELPKSIDWKNRQKRKNQPKK